EPLLEPAPREIRPVLIEKLVERGHVTCAPQGVNHLVFPLHCPVSACGKQLVASGDARLAKFRYKIVIVPHIQALLAECANRCKFVAPHEILVSNHVSNDETCRLHFVVREHLEYAVAKRIKSIIEGQCQKRS